jgi:hypothetical protein
MSGASITRVILASKGLCQDLGDREENVPLVVQIMLTLLICAITVSIC